MFIEIFIGVLAGVLTTAVLWFIKELWTKSIMPWYQAIQYKGADISGSWFVEQNYEDSSVNTFSMVLHQNAHSIYGSFQFTFKSPERSFTIDYAVTGEYWEGYLNLSCRSRDRRAFSHGAMFVKLVSNGTALIGQFSFRDATKDEVSTFPIGFDRKFSN